MDLGAWELDPAFQAGPPHSADPRAKEAIPHSLHDAPGRAALHGAGVDGDGDVAAGPQSPWVRIHGLTWDAAEMMGHGHRRASRENARVREGHRLRGLIVVAAGHGRRSHPLRSPNEGVSSRAE